MSDTNKVALEKNQLSKDVALEESQRLEDLSDELRRLNGIMQGILDSRGRTQEGRDQIKTLKAQHDIVLTEYNHLMEIYWRAK